MLAAAASAAAGFLLHAGATLDDDSALIMVWHNCMQKQVMYKMCSACILWITVVMIAVVSVDDDE
jgi:hypothetical protein